MSKKQNITEEVINEIMADSDYLLNGEDFGEVRDDDINYDANNFETHTGDEIVSQRDAEEIAKIASGNNDLDALLNSIGENEDEAADETADADDEVNEDEDESKPDVLDTLMLKVAEKTDLDDAQFNELLDIVENADLEDKEFDEVVDYVVSVAKVLKEGTDEADADEADADDVNEEDFDVDEYLDSLDEAKKGNAKLLAALLDKKKDKKAAEGVDVDDLLKGIFEDEEGEESGGKDGRTGKKNLHPGQVAAVKAKINAGLWAPGGKKTASQKAKAKAKAGAKKDKQTAEYEKLVPRPEGMTRKVWLQRVRRKQASIAKAKAAKKGKKATENYEFDTDGVYDEFAIDGDMREKVESLVNHVADKKAAEMVNEIKTKNDVANGKLSAAIKTMKNKFEKAVDGKANEAIANWIKENKVSIEGGIESRYNKDVVDGIREVFSNNKIMLPKTSEEAVEKANEIMKEVAASKDGVIAELEQTIYDLDKNRKLAYVEGVASALEDNDEKEEFMLDIVERLGEFPYEEFMESVNTIFEEIYTGSDE